MIVTVVASLLSGVWAMFLSVWWLFVILFAAKYGSRIVRGYMLKHGYLQ